MKTILMNYFSKLEEVYLSIFDTKPTISYSDDLNKEMFISDVLEDGEIEWEPKELKECPNFEKIEKIIKFKLNDEIKEYYSSFSFFYITGYYENIYLWLFPLNDKGDIERNIKEHYADGKYYFKNKQIFVIGGASKDSVDGLYICYDNAENKVFCYDAEENRIEYLNVNLKKFLEHIEASI